LLPLKPVEPSANPVAHDAAKRGVFSLVALLADRANPTRRGPTWANVGPTVRGAIPGTISQIPSKLGLMFGTDPGSCVLVAGVGPRGQWSLTTGGNMSRRCTACGRRSAATTAEWPALCQPCLDRAGEKIKPGARVICEVDDGCSGTVDRIEGGLAVVATADGKEAWVPIPELIAVAKR
jgi:hypothetical protein